MKKVVTCSQMKLLDHGTIHNMHVPSLVLMERAALATAEEIRKYLEKKNGSGNLKKERILTVCGFGNNGGDGIAIARLLHLAGIRSEIYLAGNPDKMTEETRHQWDIAMSYQVPVMNNPVWDEYTVIVDGIFGVGLSREITGNYKEIIDHMNEAPAYKAAVDIPSGIHGDTGAVLGTAFEADLTVTFAYKKRGLCLYPGRAYAGRTVVADIGIYDRDRDGSELASKAAWHIEKSDMKTLPARKPWGNKGTFGKVLLVVGSKGMCGAACLSASAALHGGAGMVKIQTVEENRIPLQSLLPEAMLTSEFDEEANKKNLNWCDVPGKRSKSRKTCYTGCRWSEYSGNASTMDEIHRGTDHSHTPHGRDEPSLRLECIRTKGRPCSPCLSVCREKWRCSGTERRMYSSD